ncbi:MAG: copper chaperone PCu(A)C [Acidimicrobiales bacterium]
MKARSLALVLTLAAAAVSLPACGDDTTSSKAAVTTTTAATAPTITAAWARTSPMEATTGAAYFTVTGGSTDDKIVSVTVDASIAGNVEMHETVESGGMTTTAPMDTTAATTMAPATTAPAGDMATTTLAPAMEMRPVDAIEVPAGKTVKLQPGGFHIMLFELVKPLVVGDTFEMTVTFATAGAQKVQVEVKDAP